VIILTGCASDALPVRSIQNKLSMKTRMLLCLAAPAFPASSSVPMLDLGPTPPTGTPLTNSLYHASNSGFIGDS